MSKLLVKPEAGYTMPKEESSVGAYPNTLVEAVYWEERHMPLADAIDGFESSTNKVTSLSESSTNEQYPSAKAVYDAIENASGGSGIITVNGTNWALASKYGTGPLSKAEAMEFLGWTEEELDAVLAIPSDTLPEPCVVYYNGYYFPQQVIEDSVFVGAVVYIPGMHYNSESYEVVFDRMYIAVQDSRPRGGDSEVVDKLYIIYGLAEDINNIEAY